MNYLKLYNNIIHSAKSENRMKGIDMYYEKHHINPSSLGGSNDKSNLVLLTAKEHFVCHHLLAKIYGGGMWYAFNMMCNMKSGTQKRQYKITSVVYENLRKQLAIQMVKMQTGIPKTKEHNIKNSIANKGKKRSKQTCIRNGLAHRNTMIYKFYNQKTDEMFEGTSYAFQHKYNYKCVQVSPLLHGTCKTLDKKQWRLI